MDIENRKLQATQKFNEITQQITDLETEKARLQGEYRLLEELETVELPKKSKKANVIEAVPEQLKEK